jgi:RHS repeat-associated protein
MVFDLHREMKIEYTQTTNLPKIIGWRRGTIENHYTFDGQKLGKKVYDYRGNLTLNERYFDELLMQNGKVRRLQHGDGYINLTQDGNPVEYFYYLKDHLGNIRATITQATPDSLLITQANDYYPFGIAYTPKITGLQPDSWNNKFKYNGKEEQEVPGGWLDYGARMYDPTLGRWHVVDPMSEASHNLSYSPYNYVVNNPIVLVDPDGMDWFYNDQTGAIVYVSNLRQGAEEHMEEGWQWMGANNMFTDDDPESNDMALLMGNQESGNVSFTQNDEEGGHTLSAYFDGNNAKSFMSDRGYDFKPITYQYHSDITTEYHPEPHGQVTQSYDNSSVVAVLTSQYIHLDLVLKSTEVLSDYRAPIHENPKSYGPMYSIRNQSWSVRKNIYGKHALGQKAGKVLNWLDKTVPWKSFYEDFWKRRIK